MRRGRGWRAVLALGTLFVRQPGNAGELRDVRASSTPTGASLSLVASTPMRVAVRQVAPLDERPRLYLDLPRGTRIAPGVRAGLRAAPPITGARLGLAEDGRLRLVFELDGPVTYRIAPPGRVVSLSITRAPVPEATVATPRPVTVVPPVGAPKIVIDPGH